MENIEAGLRRIKTRSDNVHLWRWPCTMVTLIGVLLTPIFPPLSLISAITFYFWLLLHYRLVFSKCPRCGKNFYNFFNTIFNLGYLTKSGMWAVE